MPAYELADPETCGLVEQVRDKYHPDLQKMGVRVGVIFATADGDTPAIKVNRQAVPAKISVVSVKDRLKKEYDAELVIDTEWWKNGKTKHHEAMIDHELSQLVLIENKDEGGYLTDDHGRPRLQLRTGDWFAGIGFKSVVERHGDYAPELLALRRAEAKVEEVKHRLFPVDTPPPEESNGKASANGKAAGNGKAAKKPAAKPAAEKEHWPFPVPEEYEGRTLQQVLDHVGKKKLPQAVVDKLAQSELHSLFQLGEFLEKEGGPARVQALIGPGPAAKLVKAVTEYIRGE